MQHTYKRWSESSRMESATTSAGKGARSEGRRVELEVGGVAAVHVWGKPRARSKS